MEEIWKDVIGYEGYYKASNLGNIKSLHSEHSGLKGGNMSPALLNKRYLSLCLSKQNVIKGFLVHRLVAIAFIPNPENKPEVNHKNGITTDNRVENLEWVTPKENAVHARDVIKVGLKFGEHNHFAQLKAQDVIEIRKMYASNLFKQKEIASMYKVDRAHISAIVNRKRWSHI